MSNDQPAYLTIPSAFRDAIRDVLMFGSMRWLSTTYDVKANDAMHLIRNARMSHLEVHEDQDPITGTWHLGDYDLPLEHHYYMLASI